MWAHLVSDASLEELHAFARAAAVPPRAFDLDHYDVPVERVPELVAAGAEPVSGRELLARLRRSGLRVRGADRPGERARHRRDDLPRRWTSIPHEADAATWDALGASLLARWTEPHRRYHDDAHLTDVLEHLDVLAAAGATVTRAVVLAAWFHDAVYDGAPGADEEGSARLADAWLADHLPADERAEVVRLVRLTASHAPAADDAAGAALCDADLAILAASPTRYRRYAAAVRAEYDHVPEPLFRAGRAEVLHALLAHDPLFATPQGRSRWEDAARRNVAAELVRLTGEPG